ncbi:hypothetical protein EW146_g7573 [Bondarzewia mesenterica]|uniref:BAH domain-containing protein n=1 Tax=Bondarzewia mesenterica TaxID=1095465 RepID=A0A4S4LKJ8_9AGAM|nr:hypothetical protein EW146_g7573 [Bondarzewia mesenterica]
MMSRSPAVGLDRLRPRRPKTATNRSRRTRAGIQPTTFDARYFTLLESAIVMARKRPRWTKKKPSERKQRPAKSVTVFDHIPSHAEWAKLQKAPTMVVRGNGKKRVYEQGQDVLIYGGEDTSTSKDYETHKLWVGRIVEFAGRDDLSDPGISMVWAKVQWFYSGTDIAEEVENLCVIQFLPVLKPVSWTWPFHTISDATACGRFERMLSDVHDYVPYTSLKGHATMFMFDENELDPSHIGSNQFYTRRDYEHSSRRVIVSPPIPPPPTLFTSSCPARTTGNVHLREPLQPRRRQTHAPLPAPLLPKMVPPSLPLIPPPPPALPPHPRPRAQPPVLVPRQRRPLHLPQRPARRRHPLLPVQAAIPTTTTRPSRSPRSRAPLVRLAQRQIVRGGAPHGIVGNVKPVVEARRLVYISLKADSPETRADARLVLDTWSVGVDAQNVEGLLRLDCSVDGESASEKKRGKRKQVDWEDAGEDSYCPFVCPRCGGAI